MKKIVKILVVFLLTLTLFIRAEKSNIKASSKTVREFGKEISSTNTKKLTLKTDSTALITTIPHGTLNEETGLIDGAIEMVIGETYSATYDKALDYFGKNLTVRVDVRLISTDKDSENGRIQLFIDDGGMVRSNWKKAYNTKIEWNISVFDGDEPYAPRLLVGLSDPDESNYLYDNATSRELYFRDAARTEDSVPGKDYAADSFVVEDNGLYHVDENGNKVDPSDISADIAGVSVYNNALFLVSMNGKNTFKFETITFRNGSVWVPYFYSLKGIWNVKYVMNDSETTPAINPNKDFTKYESGIDFEKEIDNPTRAGYKFLGWTRNDVKDPSSEDNYKIQKYDFGDKTFVAKWEALPQPYVVQYYYMDDQGEYPTTPDEVDDTRKADTDSTVEVTGRDKTPGKDGYVLDDNAEHIYEAVVEPDGSTVLKVYFKKNLTVIYKPGTQGVFEEQKTTDLDYGVDTPEFEGDPKGNPGYDFIGWDETPADKVTKDAIYVALWKPWKYYIEYDANGGKGEMDKQTFTYADDTMTSKSNEFTRSGYRFTGFKYEYNGDVKFVRDVDEFRDLLVEAGPGSSITLVAQWERIPEGYTAPVTGVE